MKIIDGKIYIPKRVREAVGLPEKGECEATIIGDEIRIRKLITKDLDIFKILEKKPPTQRIREMMKAEEVEDV